MTFTNMSPAQAADILAWSDSSKRHILAAIHHFSNKNLVAARRYGYVMAHLKSANVEWVNETIERAEETFPDA